MIILHNNFTNTDAIYPRVSPAQQSNMFEYSLFLLQKEIDVIRLFAGKQFEVISVCEMKLRLS